VLAINHDPTAPVFELADVGLVADWRVVVPELVHLLEAREGAACVRCARDHSTLRRTR
jgi:hypothetical protein